MKNYYERQSFLVTFRLHFEMKSIFVREPNVSHSWPTLKSSRCDVVIEGEVRSGAQEHFYLETHACLVVPREDNELCVYASTQNPTASQVWPSRTDSFPQKLRFSFQMFRQIFQAAIAEVLGIPRNRVEVKAKRLGGGFGGKETRCVPLTVWAAVAARKTRRPVRIALDRDEDMAITGTRHPALIKYKVGLRAHQEWSDESAHSKCSTLGQIAQEKRLTFSH